MEEEFAEVGVGGGILRDVVEVADVGGVDIGFGTGEGGLLLGGAVEEFCVGDVVGEERVEEFGVGIFEGVGDGEITGVVGGIGAEGVADFEEVGLALREIGGVPGASGGGGEGGDDDGEGEDEDRENEEKLAARECAAASFVCARRENGWGTIQTMTLREG